ncbi:uncharacterized protein LOC119800702 [Arvicola amphibius]|uniref:uncharacterized protein LOC119800702 n=1 Tax=Arvicola amphibius TaxID=1047088 RepID=UPI001C084045|nr:uncharacterized protein LOC119800702 [Arvicola amphibius]
MAHQTKALAVKPDNLNSIWNPYDAWGRALTAPPAGDRGRAAGRHGGRAGPLPGVVGTSRDQPRLSDALRPRDLGGLPRPAPAQRCSPPPACAHALPRADRDPRAPAPPPLPGFRSQKPVGGRSRPPGSQGRTFRRHFQPLSLNPKQHLLQDKGCRYVVLMITPAASVALVFGVAGSPRPHQSTSFPCFSLNSAGIDKDIKITWFPHQILSIIAGCYLHRIAPAGDGQNLAFLPLRALSRARHRLSAPAMSLSRDVMFPKELMTVMTKVVSLIPACIHLYDPMD